MCGKKPNENEGGKEMEKSYIINNLITEESGQGITEYGAILAFVALLIALVFGFANGTLAGAISSAFSSVVSQLNQIA